MKKLAFITALLASCFMHAQVGIGNTNPQASLDISSSSVTTPSNTDGILIPRMNEFPASDPALAQDGMMVFVTGSGTPSKGFYYWDHTAMSWVAIINTGGATLDGAYDFGGAGAGRIITADAGAIEIQDTGGLRVEGDIVAAENIIHDGDVNTFIGFKDDRVEIDAGGTNYMNIQHANSRVTFNEEGNELDFSIESGTNQNMFFVDGSTDRIGIGTNSPGTLLHIGVRTVFDTNVANSGQDGIFIRGSGTTGINQVGGSISFGGAHPVRDNSRRAAIASLQTGNDEDNVGLSFYVHGGPINTEPMVEGMRLTHNRRLGINNNNPSANLDVIGTLQYEDGNEAVGYVLASDATGNAAWTDPNTLIMGVERINDLLDGKSDIDGSEDGSSIFLGIAAGSVDDSSNNRNVGIGYQALEDNTIGSQNTALGYRSLLNNIDGTANTAVGSASLSTNTTGIWNTAVGQAALLGNLDGAYNTAVGKSALGTNSGGNSNVALGVNAIQSNTSGSFNTVIGVDAATGLNASSNTIIGRRAMNSHTAGGENVAIGAGAGYYGSGIQNTYIGTIAGNSIGTLERNRSVFLGYGAGSLETASDRLYIENTTSATPLIYGEFDTNLLRFNGDVGIGRAPATNALEVEGEASKTTAGAFIANSDRRLKKNIQTLEGKTALEKIQSLRGVTYLWNDNKTGSKRPEGIQYGFIAQEIQKVFPEKVSEDNLGYLQTAYGDYDALFVQAIKEQQLQIEMLSEENKVLKVALSKVDALETRLKALESGGKEASENAVIIVEEK